MAQVLEPSLVWRVPSMGFSVLRQYRWNSGDASSTMGEAPMIAPLSPSQELPVKAWASTSAPWAVRTQFPFCDGQHHRASTLAVRSPLSETQRRVTDPRCFSHSDSRIAMKIRWEFAATGFPARLSAVRQRACSLVNFVAARAWNSQFAC